MHCAGPRDGYVFSKGPAGIGYHKDASAGSQHSQPAGQADGAAVASAQVATAVSVDNGGVMQPLDGAACLL